MCLQLQNECSVGRHEPPLGLACAPALHHVPLGSGRAQGLTGARGRERLLLNSAGCECHLRAFLTASPLF